MPVRYSSHAAGSHPGPRWVSSAFLSRRFMLCLLHPWASRGLCVYPVYSIICKHYREHGHKRPFTWWCLSSQRLSWGFLGSWSRGLWGMSICEPGCFFIWPVCRGPARVSLGRGAVEASIKYLGVNCSYRWGLPPFSQDVQNLIWCSVEIGRGRSNQAASHRWKHACFHSHRTPGEREPQKPSPQALSQWCCGDPLSLTPVLSAWCK